VTKFFQLAVFVAMFSAAGTLEAHAANGGRDPRFETRSRVMCSDGTTLTERLRAEDGHLQIDVELEHLRHRGVWRVVIIHERQIVARATIGVPAGSVLHLRRSAPAWIGRDVVVSRATGPGGALCSATATL
jgi:hypothetical protein